MTNEITTEYKCNEPTCSWHTIAKFVVREDRVTGKHTVSVDQDFIDGIAEHYETRHHHG